MSAVRATLALVMLATVRGVVVKSAAAALGGPPAVCASDCKPCADNCYEVCVATKINDDHTKDVECMKCVEAPNGCMNTEVAGCHKCVIGACQGSDMPSDCPNAESTVHFLQRR
mmetsp:Transcript_14058/g.38657  ORF Transcript_14058/g.38657 Transcript_14058/m.38657 type:complete len:114 (+) Transcript_14058:85-426(+)